MNSHVLNEQNLTPKSNFQDKINWEVKKEKNILDELDSSTDDFSDFLMNKKKEAEIQPDDDKKIPLALKDITNQISNKYQEIFLTYAEDKLCKILPNPNKVHINHIMIIFFFLGQKN